MTRSFITAALCVALAPLAARAEGGSVDWQKKVVKCTGAGAPNLQNAGGNVAVARLGAERAAKLDALRNCIETLKGVNIKTGETVGAAMSTDPGLKSRVEAVVKNFKVLEPKRYFSDGAVEIDVEVPMDGALADVLVPTSDKAAVSTSGKPTGTGLIVNAKGLKLAPALAPRILDESGKVVYAAGVVTEDARRENGVAAYAKNVEMAKHNFNARIGAQPVVLKAIKASGSDLVISNLDADTLRGGNSAFLAQGKVVIVTD